MPELLEFVREGLMLAVALAIPLVLAALAGGVVGGLVVALLGLQEQGLATLVRAVSVVVVLILVGEALGDRVVAFTRQHWSNIAARGDAD